MRLLIFGYGFAGAALDRLLTPAGWSVTGVGRGSDPRVVLDAASAADAWLIAAPPGEAGCPGLALPRTGQPPWVGYLSTTGVYGDHGGRWVFEDTPLAPLSPEATRRAQAEASWTARGAHLFRLPGIYGPGRSAFDRLRDGTAKRLVKPGQVFSRIHVDDLAAGVAASIRRPNPGRSYNLCDDEPAAAAQVTAYAAGLLGFAAPPEQALDETTLSPMAKRFWSESKRVANARSKSELGWRPAYPTYREGLLAVLAAEA